MSELHSRPQQQQRVERPWWRRWLYSRPVGAAALVVTALVMVWWIMGLDRAGSVPAVVTYDIWPWGRWLLLVATVLAALWWVRRRVARRSQAALAAKRTKRSRRNAGLASGWEVLRESGWWWLRGKAKVLRPHLQEVSRWRRLRTPLRELGFQLCRIGGRWAFASMEEVVGVIAPPRRGKTAELASNVIDAPGSVVTTSTKYDIVEHTEPLRARRGPVYVFNPDRLAGRGSTLRWNPVIGCEAVEVATERAGYLLAGSPSMAGVADREFWQGQAVRVLRALLHAAAWKGGTMLDVLHWISDLEGTKREVRKLLAHAPGGASWSDDYNQFLGTNSNTGTSIVTSIMPALQWLSDPKVAALTTCGPEEQFDVETFLREQGTLYLLGEDKPHGTIAPLFTALTAHIATVAKQVASKSRSGRLDPPLALVLDEAPLLCPVPLDRWTSDFGSRGIPIIWAAQSRAQLRWKWGPDGAGIIWTNSTFKVVFAPGDDAEDLAMYSALAGERVTEQGEREPVLPPAAIRTLDQWHVLVFHGTMKPAVGRVRPVWDRRDVKRAKKTAERAERAERSVRRRRPRLMAAGLVRRLADRLAPQPAPEPSAARPAQPMPPVPEPAPAMDLDRELEAMLAAGREGER